MIRTFDLSFEDDPYYTYKVKYIYVYSNDPENCFNDPMYIGLQNRDFREGFSRHFEHIGNNDPQHDKFKDIKYVYIAALPSFISLSSFEVFLIQKYKPKLNLVHNTDGGRYLSFLEREINTYNSILDDAHWMVFDTSDLSKESGLTVFDIWNMIEKQKKAINSNNVYETMAEFIDNLPEILKQKEVTYFWIKEIDRFADTERLIRFDNELYLDFNFMNQTFIKKVEVSLLFGVKDLKLEDFLTKDAFLSFLNEYNSDFLFFYPDHSKCFLKSYVLSDLDRSYENISKDLSFYINYFDTAIDKITDLLTACEFNSQKINNIDKNEIEEILNVKLSDERNLLYCLLERKKLTKNQFDIICGTDFIRYHFLLPESVFTIVISMNFNKYHNVWELSEPEFFYDPDKDVIKVETSVGIFQIPVIYNEKDDTQFSGEIEPKEMEKMIRAFKSEIIPAVKNVVMNEPDFSNCAIIKNFYVDIETSTAITENDYLSSISKIGEGFNLRNFDLISNLYYLVRSSSDNRIKDIKFAGKAYSHNDRGRFSSRYERTYENYKYIGFIDLLSAFEDGEGAEVFRDCETLTLRELVDKYDSPPAD